MTAHSHPTHDHAWARALLGLPDAPPAAPSHEFIGRDDVVAGVRIQRLVLGGTADELPALLLTPVTGGSGPRVLAIHQHNDQYHLGKSEVAGLAGDPDTAYGLELARRGCTVLAPDVRGFEERMTSPGDPGRAEHRLAWDLVSQGSSLAALHLTDLRDALSWLADQPSAMPSIGTVGHSLGGQLALFLTAVDERISAAVASCGVGTLASFAATEDLLHNPSWYVPGLRTAGDVGALAAAVDQQRVLVSSGTADPLFPVDGIREVASGFRPGRAVVRLHPGGHVFPAAERSEALDWLVSELTPQSPPLPGPSV